jgi:hypothetical protein
MPMDRSKYPRDWDAISARIRSRGGDCCEGTHEHPDCRARNRGVHPETGAYVVLTTAHYPDPDPLNCDDDNLLSLCQRCHLSLDRNHHIAKARATRMRKMAIGELPLDF